jgi:hypothetical protein
VFVVSVVSCQVEVNCICLIINVRHFEFNFCSGETREFPKGERKIFRVSTTKACSGNWSIAPLVLKFDIV